MVDNCKNETDATIRPFNIKEARFSLFGAGINTPKGQIPYKQGTLKDVYDWMISPKLMQITHSLRDITDEKEQKAFKAKCLPYATFACTCSYRNDRSVLQPSGLLCIDIDHLAHPNEVWRVRELLTNPPYFTTELLFKSPRGLGVKWVTHIDLDRAPYERWYRTICTFLKQEFNIQADPAPKSLVSACFLCSDANLYINPLIVPF